MLPALDVAGSPGGEVALRPPGKVSFLNFFATWCGPCQEEMPDLRQVRAHFDEADVQMVSITSETDEDAVGEFWQEYEGTWPVAIDVELEATEKWSVSAYPTNMVFTADGERLGVSPLRTFEQIREAIETALEESD